MKNINLIGFHRANGIHWCNKPDDYHYEDIALVKNNGKIVWHMNKEDIPVKERFTILFSARKKEEEYLALEDGLKEAEKRMKNAINGTLEYFNAVHSYYWHRDAIESANC